MKINSSRARVILSPQPIVRPSFNSQSDRSSISAGQQCPVFRCSAFSGGPEAAGENNRDCAETDKRKTSENRITGWVHRGGARDKYDGQTKGRRGWLQRERRESVANESLREKECWSISALARCVIYRGGFARLSENRWLNRKCEAIRFERWYGGRGNSNTGVKVFCILVSCFTFAVSRLVFHVWCLVFWWLKVWLW